MTPSERDLYVLLWRKVYRWLLARDSWQLRTAGELGWLADEETWQPPDQAGGQPVQPMCEIPEPERQREHRVWSQILGSATYLPYLHVINGEPLASSLLRWTQWGFVLTKAETDGVLQPDEVGFIRGIRREVLYQAVMVEVIAHDAQPCTCPLWHCAQHPNTGNG